MTLDPIFTERCIEALLFAAAEPLSVQDLAKRLPDGADIKQGVADLRLTWAGRGAIAAFRSAWLYATRTPILSETL